MKVQLLRAQTHAHACALVCARTHYGSVSLSYSPTPSLTHSPIHTHTHTVSLSEWQMYVKPLHDNPGIKVTDEYWTDNFEIVERCAPHPLRKEVA